MYYYISILITVLLFSAIQYNEYRKSKYNNKKYNLLNITNFVVILIIYILTIIILFYLFETNSVNEIDVKSKIHKDTFVEKNSEINTDFLKKIPDNINIGFTPYNE